MNTKVISPDVVDLWEAILTLAFFGILVVLSYMADKKFYLGSESDEEVNNENSGTLFLSIIY